MKMILPGATIGFLGGGQLARMSAMAARDLGYGVRVLDPDPACAASGVADDVICASFNDQNAFLELSTTCAVVTWDIERIDARSAKAIAERMPLRPGVSILEMVQDRGLQKSWLQRQGFPVGSFSILNSEKELLDFSRAASKSIRLKSCRGGYDGRSQFQLLWPFSQEDVCLAWKNLGSQALLAEEELDLQMELSILVARNPSGESAIHPIAQNWHRSGVLDVSVLPAKISETLHDRISDLALSLAERLTLEGILVIECFVDQHEQLLINELAPRPHNTFHASEIACATSQFEQHIRSVCNLPLGSTEMIRPAALANLLGDAWLSGPPPGLQNVLRLPGVQLRLYGKTPRPGRKIGHLLATGASSSEALARVKNARNEIQSLLMETRI